MTPLEYASAIERYRIRPWTRIKRAARRFINSLWRFVSAPHSDL